MRSYLVSYIQNGWRYMAGYRAKSSEEALSKFRAQYGELEVYRVDEL